MNYPYKQITLSTILYNFAMYGPCYNMDDINTTHNVRSKQYKFDDRIYDIYNYEREFICDDNDRLRLCKSLIYDNGELLSMAPPKSISYKKFTDLFEFDKENIEISQLVEGTMINMFYNHNNNKWHISTRGAIGGQYFYFRNQYYQDKYNQCRQISFYDMFMEALQAGEKEELNDLTIMKLFDKEHTYSFVLQHPDNHIVIPIDRPRLYLVAIHKMAIENNIPVCISIDKSQFKDFEFVNVLSGIIDIPELYNDINSYDEAIEKYSSIDTTPNDVGIVFYHKNMGVRSKVLCHRYETMKTLRGNNPNIQFQYICLRRTNKVNDFLNYFPRYKKLFYIFYTQYRDFMKNVHNSYIKCYIKKTGQRISNKYMPHIYRIHQECFVPYMLKGEKKIIKIDDVYKYFDTRNVGEILYALNYDVRNVMDEKIESEEKDH